MTQTPTAPAVTSRTPADVRASHLAAEPTNRLTVALGSKFMLTEGLDELINELCDTYFDAGYDHAVAVHHIPTNTSEDEDDDEIPGWVLPDHDSQEEYRRKYLGKTEDPDAAENYWQPIYDSGVAPDRYAE